MPDLARTAQGRILTRKSCVAIGLKAATGDQHTLLQERLYAAIHE